MCPRIAAATAALIAALALAAPAAAGPVSSHAQVYTCCMPAEQADRAFSESKAMGADYIRVDFELNPIFGADGTPDWSNVDRILELSRKYQLRVLGVLLNGPVDDPAAFGRMAGDLAVHTRGLVDRWEILNEPDADWAFHGTPEDYARILSESHDAIRSRAPEDLVALGGLATPWHTDWLERVFATPGADAARKFEIASVHLRGPVTGLAHNLAVWRAELAGHGFRGPIWVTEHGYAADSEYQTDPAYVGGEQAQAAYLRHSLLSLAEGGADEVFVTLRDEGERQWASEGVEDIGGSGQFAVRRKPAFDVVRRFSQEWPSIVQWRVEQHVHEHRATMAEGLVATSDLRRHALEQRRHTARRALAVERRRLRRLRRAFHKGHRTLRKQVKESARHVNALEAGLRRARRDVGRAIAQTAAYRGDQVSNAIQAADLKKRIEG